MRHLQVKQLLRIDSKSLDILKNAQSILDELENDFIEMNDADKVSILKSECSDAWSTLTDFLDEYEEYIKEN